MPVNPERLVERAADSVFEELAAVFEDGQGPEEARRWALEAARCTAEILEERHELGVSPPGPGGRRRPRLGDRVGALPYIERLYSASIRASASISTRISVAMRRLTSTMLVAGLIFPKHAPWASPTFSQSSMLTT